MHVIQEPEREREVSQNKCVRKKFHLLICVRRGCARVRARGEESRKIYVHHVLSSIYFIYFDMRTHTFFPAAAAYVPCAVRASENKNQYRHKNVVERLDEARDADRLAAVNYL
jgi:hypothetical protein